MNWLRHVSPILLGSLLLACDGPTAPEAVARAPHAMSMAANAGPACYPVMFRTSSWYGQPPFDVEGTIAGDLEGTIGVDFDLTTLRPAGKTAAIAGMIHFTVTGGVLPVAFPLVFTGEFVQLNVNNDSRVSPGTVSEQSTRIRATSGIRAANLTMHGSFDASVGIAYHTHRGVICP